MTCHHYTSSTTSTQTWYTSSSIIHLNIHQTAFQSIQWLSLKSIQKLVKIENLQFPPFPTSLSSFLNLRDWLKDMQVASGVIYLGLEEGQKSQIEDYLDDPKKMWETLESIHVQKRPSTRFKAYNSLLSISQLVLSRELSMLNTSRPLTQSMAISRSGAGYPGGQETSTGPARCPTEPPPLI